MSPIPRMEICYIFNSYKKQYKLFEIKKFISYPPTFQLIQQPLSRTTCWIKSLHSFQTNIKWNLATRLKSATYKSHVIKEHCLKWMSYRKMNQSHDWSYDETLFFSYQKVPKVNIFCSYSKDYDLDWLEDSL